MKNNIINKDFQVVLIGGGIMSATLGILLQELNPDLKITIFERLDSIAKESSDAWNNAGTGHSAFCELNYTPQNEDGNIDIKKAVKIASSFEISKTFWSYLVKNGYFSNPESFINNIPHISFVWGKQNVSFLKARYEALKSNALFSGMEYTEDSKELIDWMPLVMQNREPNEPAAATRMALGTDVNFGHLTRVLIDHLDKSPNVKVHLNTQVEEIKRQKNGKWLIETENIINDKKLEIEADFVFIGAGGGSLPLLEKSNIEEGEGYGGFPVSGQWLVCKNKAIIEKHNSKVYGKASVGAPPMSMPHLDTRIINGEKALLFGPFAGFSTKFLKNGSYLDLFLSVELDNILPILSAGIHNVPLTKYLIEQVSLSLEDKIEALKEYFPEAKIEDWEIAIAGQRVQIIKKDKEQGGVLEFGTEIINAQDGSLAALLGASPGASTSVSVMLNVLEKCFPVEMGSLKWKKKLEEIIPNYDKNFVIDKASIIKNRAISSKILRLLD
jgi:malate dehydrogenase (quinone)